jgi:hypothetical protein
MEFPEILPPAAPTALAGLLRYYDARMAAFS